MLDYWVLEIKTIINHPPVITIFIGGMVTIPKWVVYDIVLPTLLEIKKKNIYLQ